MKELTTGQAQSREVGNQGSSIQRGRLYQAEVEPLPEPAGPIT